MAKNEPFLTRRENSKHALKISVRKKIAGKLALSVNSRNFAPHVLTAPFYFVSLIQEQSNNRGNMGFPVCSPFVPAGISRVDFPAGYRTGFGGVSVRAAAGGYKKSGRICRDSGFFAGADAKYLSL